MGKMQVRPTLIRKCAVAILAFAYLLMMAYFAWRPFQGIPGMGYPHASLAWADGSVHLQSAAALEGRRNSSDMRRALMATGQMSLTVSLQVDSLQQTGPARIISYSRSQISRNFTLGQEGDELSFRLRTTQTDDNGVRSSLSVPKVFETNSTQHVVITYDGVKTKLYVNGECRVESSSLNGDFSNWGRNQVLVMGDEPSGGRPWRGRLQYVSIYDRALTSDEIVLFQQGREPSAPVLVHDFRALKNLSDLRRHGLIPLRYRNLFILSGPYIIDPVDCLFNIIGFLPLGMFSFLMLSMRFERPKILAVILAPLLTGLAASGSIEYMQRYLDGRVPCMQDISYNVAGSLTGGLLVWLACSAYKKRAIKGTNV